MAEMSLVACDRLEVTFGNGSDAVRAVRGITFDVARGQSFGIVGESGSGKSTVLRAICGLAPISGGTVRIDGAPVATPRSAGFYRNVQMVFQDP
jgi:peptide/nickel transport system ATP-binding protein